MKRARLIPLLVLAALVVALALTTSPPTARGQAGIIVDGAKQVRTEGVRYGGIPAGVPVRIVLDSAEKMRQEGVTAPPAALRNLFAAVPLRIVLESAEIMRYVSGGAPPPALRTVFAKVPLRVILESAEVARHETLVYPIAFFNDRTAPVIRDIRVRPDANGLRVLWETDEYSTSEVRFGTTPGGYGNPIVDRFYVRQHGVLIPNAAAGRTYYFAVASADRSGNRAASGENQVRAQSKLFLPLIVKR